MCSFCGQNDAIWQFAMLGAYYAVMRRKKCALRKQSAQYQEILLASFFNSNSHGNGHTDHGVVACAQEAHHLNIKPHLRWCLHWDTTTFSAGNPIFHKTRSTSFESIMMCFPSLGTSYHIMCSRNKCFNLNYTPSHIFYHLFTSFKINQEKRRILHPFCFEK